MMPERKPTSLTCPVLRSSPPAVPRDVLAAQQSMGIARSCYVTHQEQQTARQYLQIYEATQVEGTGRTTAIMERYFEQSFAERGRLFEKLFSRLDVALEQGNDAAFDKAVGGTVDIAKASPLDGAGAQFERIADAFRDKSHVWDL